MDKKAEMDFLHSNYFITFSTNAGQSILEDLRSFCYYDRPTYSSGVNPYDMAFREGKRAVYLHILNRIEKGKRQTKEA